MRTELVKSKLHSKTYWVPFFINLDVMLFSFDNKVMVILKIKIKHLVFQILEN